MQYKVETIIKKVLFWEELSKERQEEEYKKVLESERSYYSFSDMFYNDYLYELKDLQEKYDLNIEPIYSDGSQHGLLGFKSLDSNYDDSLVRYKGEDFYFEIDRLDNIKVFNNIDDEDNEDMKKLTKQLEDKIKSFIEDFMKIYNVYQEYFMYGYCKAFEDFVKQDLEENDYEYEENVESFVKVLTK
jgi:tRNA nucleotidyltransferase/poly(A) polymerase